VSVPVSVWKNRMPDGSCIRIVWPGEHRRGDAEDEQSGHRLPKGRLAPRRPRVALGALEIGQPLRRPAVRGSPEPEPGLRLVPGHPSSFAVQHAQVILSVRVALLGRLTIPLRRALVAPGNSPSGLVRPCQTILLRCIPVPGRSGVPSRGLTGALPYAPTRGVRDGEVVLCEHVPLLGGPTVPFRRLPIVPLHALTGRVSRPRSFCANASP
jgi:hypothetical protein